MDPGSFATPHPCAYYVTRAELGKATQPTACVVCVRGGAGKRIYLTSLHPTPAQCAQPGYLSEKWCEIRVDADMFHWWGEEADACVMFRLC